MKYIFINKKNKINEKSWHSFPAKLIHLRNNGRMLQLWDWVYTWVLSETLICLICSAQFVTFVPEKVLDSANHLRKIWTVISSYRTLFVPFIFINKHTCMKNWPSQGGRCSILFWFKMHACSYALLKYIFLRQKRTLQHPPWLGQFLAVSLTIHIENNMSQQFTCLLIISYL